MKTSARARYTGYRFPAEIIGPTLPVGFAHGGGVAGGSRQFAEEKIRTDAGDIKRACNPTDSKLLAPTPCDAQSNCVRHAFFLPLEGILIEDKASDTQLI